MAGLEGLEGMTQSVGGGGVDPGGAAGAAVSHRGELALVAKLAVDLSILSIIKSVKCKLLLAFQARGAFFCGICAFWSRLPLPRTHHPHTAGSCSSRPPT